MNPLLQQFMPGIGQPINPQALAQGQGMWSPQQLAQGFEMARGQGATLGNPEAVRQAQAQQQNNLAEMMSRYRAAQSQGDFGDALMGTQYVQNSGALGALAQALSMGIGGRVKRLADEKASDYAGRVFAEQQRMERELKAEDEAKATRLRNEEIAREDGLRSWQAAREDAQLAREDARWNAQFDLQRRSLDATIANRNAQNSRRGYMIGPEQARAAGLAPGNYWVDESGKPSPIQAPQAAPKTPEEQARAEALAKDIPTLQDARNAFQRYRDLVSEYGTEQLPGIFGGNKAQLDAAYGTARDAIRVLGNTGTLNMGELPFLEQRMAPATNILGAIGGNATGSQILDQIDENMRFLDEKEARIRGLTLAEFNPEKYGNQQPAIPQPAGFMGGGGMTPNLANPSPASGPWQLPQGWSVDTPTAPRSR